MSGKKSGKKGQNYFSGNPFLFAKAIFGVLPVGLPPTPLAQLLPQRRTMNPKNIRGGGVVSQRTIQDRVQQRRLGLVEKGLIEFALRGVGRELLLGPGAHDRLQIVGRWFA